MIQMHKQIVAPSAEQLGTWLQDTAEYPYGHPSRAPEIAVPVEAARALGGIVMQEAVEISVNERSLTDVDIINRSRRPDGSIDTAVLDALRPNLVTRVKEPAMPFAVSTTYQKFANGRYWWAGMDSIQVARNGRLYHKHPAALVRVGVEEAEATHVQHVLRPGVALAFISPKMSLADGTAEIAKQECVGDDDALRLNWLDVDNNGQVRGKFVQSILVRDVPLQAWVDMLADPGNIFGKSVTVANPQSSLSVMKVFAELEIPLSAIPGGVVDILDAVIPYIKDANARQKTMAHARHFRERQAYMHEIALQTAERWLVFETALADSLHSGYATAEVEQFVAALNDNWTDEDLALIAAHRLPNGLLTMTRTLAARIEQAKENTLWAQAGVAVGNERIITQMDPAAARQLLHDMMEMGRLMQQGVQQDQLASLERKMTKLVADENVSAGGGCPGETGRIFKNKKKNISEDADSADSMDATEAEAGICWVRVNCPHCSHLNHDGSPKQREKVDAYYDVNKTIHCTRCAAYSSSDGRRRHEGFIAPREQEYQERKERAEREAARLSKKEAEPQPVFAK